MVWTGKGKPKIPRLSAAARNGYAKVAGSLYFNVLASSDTLFSHGATTGFPYNCASRQTGPPVAGGADDLEMPCSRVDVAVRSKLAYRSCRRCPRNDNTLKLQH